MKPSVFFIFLLFFSLSFSFVFSNEPVYIAIDENEWPPYTFYERVNNIKTDKLTGFTVELIREIFNSNNINYEIHALPWSRALYEVEIGRKYTILLDASYSQHREKKFYISNKIYENIPFYFFSLLKYPKGLNVNTKEELLNYDIGGINGYNYSYCVPNSIIQRGAVNYTQLIKKLHSKRFDLFLVDYETLYGFSFISNDYLNDKNLKGYPVNKNPSTTYHVLFSKNKKGKILLDLVNKELINLKNSGKYYELYYKYFPQKKNNAFIKK